MNCCELVDGGLIELGAHTSHHPMLPQLSFERQKEEIQSSKRDLESLLGKKIAGFSYPNGRATVDAKTARSGYRLCLCMYELA